MRTTFLIAFLLVSSVVEAKSPTLRSLIALMSCADSLCMDDYARRYDLCRAAEDKGDPIWVSCDALASSDSLRMILDGGLMVLKKRQNDGSTSDGYGYSTADRKHAAKLTKELKQLGMVEYKKLSNGGAVYSSTGKAPPYRVMRQEQTMQVNERTVSVWVFVVMEYAD